MQTVNNVLCFTCYAERTLLLCHFGAPHTLALRLAFALSHAKSNYSRTSAKCARKSNHSRTYAITGGGGYPEEVKETKEVEEVDYNRAIPTPAFTTTLIDIVGAPTFPKAESRLPVQEFSGKKENSLDRLPSRLPSRLRAGRASRASVCGARININSKVLSVRVNST
jgi:hypothetical protein